MPHNEINNQEIALAIWETEIIKKLIKTNFTNQSITNKPKLADNEELINDTNFDKYTDLKNLYSF